MEPFLTLDGVVGLLNRNNVDTDQIIPKQFLKKVERTGFGVHAFHDWRYLADGSTLDPKFELNQPNAQGASILLTGDNFGCGSSREHAPWSLEDYGFKVIIAISYADIFYNNCFKNGMLPIVVDAATQAKLVAEVEATGKIEFHVDVQEQTLTTPKGQKVSFKVDPFRKNSLLKGLDEIGWTLTHLEQINAFEAKQKAELPWLWK